MTTGELLRLFEQAVEVPVGSLAPETRIESVEEWDSLGWLAIMAVLDQRVGVEIGSSEIRGFVTVSDLLEHIASNAQVE